MSLLLKCHKNVPQNDTFLFKWADSGGGCLLVSLFFWCFKWPPLHNHRLNPFFRSYCVLCTHMFSYVRLPGWPKHDLTWYFWWRWTLNFTHNTTRVWQTAISFYNTGSSNKKDKTKSPIIHKFLFWLLNCQNWWEILALLCNHEQVAKLKQKNSPSL